MVLARWNKWRGKAGVVRHTDDALTGNAHDSPDVQTFKSYYAGSLRGLDVQDRDLLRTKRGMGLAMAVNVPAFRCVRVIGQTIGGFPYQMVDIETDKVVCRSNEPKARHPMLRAFQTQYKRSGQPFFSLWSQALSVAGECYLEPLYNPIVKQYTGVEWLNPLAVEVNAPMQRIEGYFYSGQDGPVTLTPQQVVYDRTFNILDDVRGLSPIEVAIDQINVDRDTKRAMIAWFRNNALPPVIYSLKEGARVSAAQWDDFIKQLENQHKGVTHFYTALATALNIEVTTVDMPDVDKNIDLLKHMELLVYVAFGVPPAVAGDTSNTPYKDAPETYEAFWNQALGPQVGQIEMAVNTLLLPYYDSSGHYRFEFDTSEYDEKMKDQQQRVAVNSQLYRDSSITVQTYRERVGVSGEETATAWNDLPDMVYLPALNAPIPLQELPNYWQWQKSQTALELYNKGGITLNDMLEMTGRPKVEHGDVYSVSANTITVPADQIGMIQPKQTFAPEGNGNGQAALPQNGSVDIAEPETEPPEDIKALAQGEMLVWQKVIKNKNKSAEEFECRYIRADIEAFIKSKLSSTIPYKGLFIEARAMLEVKAIQATRLDFENTVEDLIAQARQGTISRRKFTPALRGEIGRYMRLAYRDGLIDGGVADGEPNDQEQESLEALVREKQALAKALSAQIYAKGLSDAQAQAKPAQWYKGTAGIAYSAALISAGENSNYEFTGDDGAENCIDCRTLKGQVHRLNIWDKHGLNLTAGAYPGQPTECGGHNCKHLLGKSSKRAYGRITLSTWKSHTHKAEFDESEHPRDEGGQFTSGGGGSEGAAQEEDTEGADQAPPQAKKPPEEKPKQEVHGKDPSVDTSQYNSPDPKALDAEWSTRYTDLKNGGDMDKMGVEASSYYSEDGYETMNRMLRTGDTGDPDRPAFLEQPNIGAMDHLINKYPLDRDIKTYRGDNGGGLPNGGDLTDKEFLALDGTSFHDAGYTSTSVTESGAFKRTQYHYEILAPKGTRGAYLAPISGNPEENEFVLGRGNDFDIVDAYIDEQGQRRIIAQVRA
jgi:HK97 family phage portal protein